MAEETVDVEETDAIFPRVGAEILDNLASILLSIIAIFIFFALAAVIQPVSELLKTLFMILGVLIALIVYFGYEPILEYYWSGKTLGKKATGIKVVKCDGTEIGAREAFLRNLPVLGYIIPYAGLFMYVAALIGIASSNKRQRLFDRAAGTVVVKDSS